ncbi:hypothetical protein KFK09_006711 [Dendrobium nobile]|uniref:Uncharacterized protein n=1 Tax=Dendrobium nobile TaxID=94219 RepID=A0A8T3BSC8_DENNO|nr:hypothetical protein KFK09_006711 [Dendrobium nobile]
MPPFGYAADGELLITFVFDTPIIFLEFQLNGAEANQLLEDEDYERPAKSVDMHDNFDQIGLAQKVIASWIYILKVEQSIALSKKDNLYKDAMETCSQSGDRELSEELLVYFIEKFIREYTGKVDELIKDKIEAQNEVKTKEHEEKEMVAQQNMYAQLLPLALPAPPMPGMGGIGGGFAPPPPPLSMGGIGMPPMPPFGMPQMGSY